MKQQEDDHSKNPYNLEQQVLRLQEENLQKSQEYEAMKLKM